MRRAHRRPRDPGLAIPLGSRWFMCVACPCGRFVIRQGLGRSWQVLGRMAGAVDSKNKYFLLSEYIERYGTGSHRLLVWIFDWRSSRLRVCHSLCRVGLDTLSCGSIYLPQGVNRHVPPEMKTEP